MCGERMRLDVREIRDAIPGQPDAPTRLVREWICRECDHFEEVESGEG